VENAYEELIAYLDDDERVERIVFGKWGWGNGRDKLGFGEPDPPPVPFDQRGKLLTLDEARPYMEGWCFDGGYGAPECYATYIWTDRRVIWVSQYDGSTWLCSALRHPSHCWPDMSGG